MRLRGNQQARALRHIARAEHEAGTAIFAADVQTPDIRHCVVVGGGTIGAEIACALLNAGIGTTLVETDEESVARARSNVETMIAASLKRGLIDGAGAAARRGKFSATVDYSRAQDADLAIEAAFESIEETKNVFGALEQVMRPDAVLATNTSCLDINEIARELQDPARLVGLHFSAPAHRMKLLEIVQGRETSARALMLGFSLAGKLGKVPVQAGVCDGLIENRIVTRYREAADILLMDGTNPWELDEAMVAFGFAMGPYEALDLSGLDVALANRRRQEGARDPNRRYIPISDRMVEEGRLGRKVGVGWYRYPGGGGKVVDPLIEDLVREEAYFAKVERIEFSDDEIRSRLLLAMINEAADILDEGIAHSARDIDLVSVFSFGFPRWRGGLMWYADRLGVEAIYEQLRALTIEDPLIWKPSRLIEACAKSGRTFSSYRPGARQA